MSEPVNSDAYAPAAPVDAAGVAAAVRRNALWAGAAAAIMLWYGFNQVVLDPSAATLGQYLFVYTLQAGGVLMAISALLSLSGARVALLFDGVFSVLIGLALLAAAGLMYSQYSMQSLLNVLFSLVFLHSGYRNWEEYRALSAASAGASGAESDVPPV